MAQAPSNLAEEKLNLLRAGLMLVGGVVIIAIDGQEQRWRVGGANGAPAVYFAYLFAVGGLLWGIFALRSYLRARDGRS